jgi:hypothetical protein
MKPWKESSIIPGMNTDILKKGRNTVYRWVGYKMWKKSGDVASPTYLKLHSHLTYTSDLRNINKNYANCPCPNSTVEALDVGTKTQGKIIPQGRSKKLI